METNTVVLSLSAYNELREFKEKMETSGNVYRSAQPYQSYWAINGASYSPVTYITVDEALIEVLERNETITKINDKLASENSELKRNSFAKEKLAKMSIWEFIKWRKTF